MLPMTKTSDRVRRFRNESLYRSLTRTLRVYDKRMLDGIRAQGFADFSSAFPQILSNLDLGGTRIGVLASRAGVTRQAVGQLVDDIERCGYVQRKPSQEDARATLVVLTKKGQRLMDTILGLARDVEASFAELLGHPQFESVRAGLVRIADAVDPIGAFGARDHNARERQDAP
jgi:DNA-binding MarR family transcriptional regulator